jgi:Ribonuclease HII
MLEQEDSRRTFQSNKYNNDEWMIQCMYDRGVDEVGRGWLGRGRVVAGAVILGEPIEGLKDSKLLTKKTARKAGRRDTCVSAGVRPGMGIGRGN